jgi:hypothetical protein
MIEANANLLVVRMATYWRIPRQAIQAIYHKKEKTLLYPVHEAVGEKAHGARWRGSFPQIVPRSKKCRGVRVSSKQSNFFFSSNRNKPKLNLFRLFFGLFRETKKYFLRFVSVFRTGIETTETNRTLSKQTKTNWKNLQKTFSIRGSSKQLFFSRGLNQNSICFGCFLVCFFAKSKNLFSVVSVFWAVSKPKQTELMVREIKKVDNLKNLLLFRLVFCLFRLFRNTKTPFFDIKAKQPKQTSCFR